MKTMYLAAHFVKQFIFDDVYYGIVAKKCGIKPFSSTNFLENPDMFMGSDKKFVIAAHLKGNLSNLENVWKEQVTSIILYIPIFHHIIVILLKCNFLN